MDDLCVVICKHSASHLGQSPHIIPSDPTDGCTYHIWRPLNLTRHGCLQCGSHWTRPVTAPTAISSWPHCINGQQQLCPGLGQLQCHRESPSAWQRYRQPGEKTTVVTFVERKSHRKYQQQQNPRPLSRILQNEANCSG